MNKLAKSIERILSEDALKHIYQCERHQRPATLQSIAGALQITLDETARLTSKMAVHTLLYLQNGDFHLTREGRDYALQVIRAHRLWERYLADETGYAEAEWHGQADKREHDLSPADTAALSARLGHPTHDPHGDPIPTAEGKIPMPGGQPLAALPIGQPVQIVHLEDEPELIYAQLVAEGLAPGLKLWLIEVSPQHIHFRADHREYNLAPVVAANIMVTPLPKEQTDNLVPTQPLAELRLAEQGEVISISPACRGPERRRFMDLGILPGAVVMAEIRSPGGDPTAYRIRGALIALRQEQAKLINIRRLKEVNA